MSAAMANPASAPTVWSIRELLAWTTTYLSQKGFESPRLEAQILLAHVLKCPRIELVARSDEEPSPHQRTAFRELVKRRVEGWPVAYLTGTKEFFLLPFHVSPAVLIPRPDTETLVLETLNRLKGAASPHALELGTGSGCVAVALAANHKTCRVLAVDASPDAAEVARRNAQTNRVDDRVTIVVGDLFDPVPQGSTFDAIISNPPYVAQSEYETLAMDIRDHEPRMALVGGPDGLAFYRRIAQRAEEFTKPGGWVILEIGETQADAVASFFPREKGFEVKLVAKDAGGRPRVVVIHRK